MGIILAHMIKRNRRLVSFLLLVPFLLACGLTSRATDVVQPAITQIVFRSTPQPISLPEVVTNEEAVLVDLYRRANPSVVRVTTYISQGNLLDSSGVGSGFVYDETGHIVTNAHVVHGSSQVDVTFSDGSIQSGTIIGEDPHSDLAVIEVAELPLDARPLPLADIDQVAVGQTVVAIGNPFGLGGTLTRGIVSALGRSIPALTSFSIPQSIQTDAPINPGNSGGPLLNLKGEVIGVNAQIETTDGARVNSGVGFAIPASIVARVVPQLIELGKYDWPWLGVSGGTVFPSLVKAMSLPVERGAYIVDVYPNTPAEDSDLRGFTEEVTVDGRPVPVGGDIITAIDGSTVVTFEDILLYLTLHTEPGQQITLTILRDGQYQDIVVTLQRRPDRLEP